MLLNQILSKVQNHVLKQKKITLGSSVKSNVDQTRRCNVGDKTYYINYQCKDSEGNIVFDTTPQNLQETCLINGTNETIKRKEIPIAEKSCSCNCYYGNTSISVGDTYTDSRCDVDGKNICKSCTATGMDPVPKNGQCVCDNYHRWNGQRCVRKPINCNTRNCKSWVNSGNPRHINGNNQTQVRTCTVYDPYTKISRNDGQGLHGGSSCSVRRDVKVAIPEQNCVYKDSWDSSSNCNQKLKSRGAGPYNGGKSCPTYRTRKSDNPITDANNVNLGPNKTRNCNIISSII